MLLYLFWALALVINPYINFRANIASGLCYLPRMVNNNNNNNNNNNKTWTKSIKNYRFTFPKWSTIITTTTKTWTKSVKNYQVTCPRWSWHRTRRSSLPPSHWKFWWQVLPSLLCEVQLSVIILKENILIKGLDHCHYRWKSAHRPITLPPSTKVPPVIALMVRSSFSWWTTTSANKLSTTTTTWSQRHHQQSSPQNNTRLRVAATCKNIINNKNNLTNNDLMTTTNNNNLGQGSELQLPSSAGRSKSGHLDFGNTNIFDDESWSLLSTIMLKIYIWSAHPPWGQSTILVLTPSPQVAEQGPQLPMLHEPDPPWQGNSYSPSHNTIINMKKTSHLGGLLY